jgi:hypothetical protein
MRSNIYSTNDDNEKCQCITLDASGNILGSNDTLFETKRITPNVIKSEFPFLWGIISYLKGEKETETPLFFPQVDFEINDYRSICDFTFMRTVDARGIQRIIWVIYDNSIHYKHLMGGESFSKRKKTKLRLMF